MRPGSPELPVGVVFRRLSTGVEYELARSVLSTPARAERTGRTGGRWTWFGLCDLAATGGTGLLGTAAIRQVAPGVAHLRGWTVLGAPPWSAIGERLVREVADSLRADGVQHVVTRLTEDRRQERALLHRVGFLPVGRQCVGTQVPDDADGSAGWLSLEL